MGLSPLLAVLVVGALVNLSLAVVGWRRRQVTGAVPFVVMTLGIAYWTALDAVQYALTDLAVISAVARISYLGNAVVPMAAFVFIVTYTGHEDWLTRPVLAFVTAWPLLTAGLALTTHFHGLMWTDRTIRTTTPVTIPETALGPLFWVNILVVYSLVFVALGLLAKMLVETYGRRRWQATLVTAAVLLPIAANVPWLLGASPIPGLDLTPFGFLGTGILLGIALFSFGFLDLAPVARHAIVEEMRDPVVAVDRQGRIADLNPAAARLLTADGDRSAVLGTPAEGTVPGYSDLVTDPASPPPDGGRRTDAAIESDGSTRFFDAQSSGLTDGGDDHVGYLVILRDVTELHQREAELAESERRNRTLVDLLPGGLVGLFDEDLRYVRVGGGALDELEYSSEDFEGTRIPEFHTAGYVDRFLDNYRAVFEAERSEFEFSHADRRYRTYLVPVTDENGDVVSGLAFTMDVTELRERERELEQYETIMETVPDVVFVLDAEGTLLNVNTRGTEVMGYTEEEFEGMAVTDLIEAGFLPEEIVSKYEQSVRELLSDDDKSEAIYRYEGQDASGEPLVFETHLALRPSDDEFRGTIGVTRDVTEREQVRRDLEHQNERLEEFVGVVSHDLRNPLNVIQGRLDLAATVDDPAAHVDRASEAADRMEQLIEDLLELARTGSDVEETESVSLAAVAHLAWETIDAPDARLEVDTDATVEADKSRLRQALENLFRNAVEHGGEDVTVRLVDAPDGFAVVDDGPGFPPDEDVLERGVTTDEAGTGFGLSIVEQVARAHGWNVTATDDESGGARVEFTGV